MNILKNMIKTGSPQDELLDIANIHQFQAKFEEDLIFI